MEIGTNLTRFEQKIRIYLNTHQDQLAVQEIRRNKQITTLDRSELEKIFVEAGLGTTADIDYVKDAKGGLGLFLRSLTGLEREAAALAFDSFQQGKALTASPLRFVNELIDYLALQRHDRRRRAVRVAGHRPRPDRSRSDLP
ncbi:type I restriction-modification enzyme R subunit C-terminal domain-containing protein [Streptomyces kebangsaanensis]|uniref:type I restriction-modification enzyme R subunit C-terminal domain-containing protein n=1 Tax=Streptomyces kebangsaanensis TaxID=864058 RepID=UPI000A4C4C13|nr:type I restriction-modification enzyme R subunit C-terminal domain-containing protein [Streptomyces kebangsaanensis]